LGESGVEHEPKVEAAAARLGEDQIMSLEHSEAKIFPKKKVTAGMRKTLQRRAISLLPEEFVTTEYLQQGQMLPLVLKPNMRKIKLADWVKNNMEFIEASLMTHGGILFREFALSDLVGFQEVVRATSVQLMHYAESATPRTELSDRFYTSTEFPPTHSIALHNELTYVSAWPMKIWFFCATPAAQGGETPIADVRKVFNNISPEVRDRFIRKGWMLVRNFGDGLGLPWQRSFHTSDKAEVEEYFSKAGIEYEWKGEGRLRTRQVRPAVAQHPGTGENVWFNHIAFWHITSLPAKLRESMLVMLKEEEFPYNVYYGDGSPIEASVVKMLREAYEQETVVFPWQKGDLLMLDNMLVAHGRKPYAGERKILVAMGQPFSRSGL
jgi:alpha-ketoglutarate-dependent taurine dioxygenase